MLRLVLCLLLLVGAHAAVSQETREQHQESAEQSDAFPASRFRIIQSDLAARLTFRLDRYSGMVSQIVRDVNGNNYWQAMPISPAPVVKTPDHPRFQLFTSGLAIKFTFLIDNDTGKTWQFVKMTSKAADGTESEVNSWELLPD